MDSRWLWFPSGNSIEKQKGTESKGHGPNFLAQEGPQHAANSAGKVRHTSHRAHRDGWEGRGACAGLCSREQPSLPALWHTVVEQRYIFHAQRCASHATRPEATRHETRRRKRRDVKKRGFHCLGPQDSRLHHELQPEAARPVARAGKAGAVDRAEPIAMRSS